MTAPEPDETAWRFATRAVHAGQEPDAATGAVVPPIYQTSTFARADLSPTTAFTYARRANPTSAALESCLASLESGAAALVFASGMAAVSAVADLLRPGERIAVLDSAYGNTRQLFTKIVAERGIQVDFVDFTDGAHVARALALRPALVWVESPSNPLLKVIDIAMLAGQAHAAGATLVVDNTFASPYLQRPLELGADIVVHSTTKYIAGHSDVLGGALIVRDAAIGERLAAIRYLTGGVQGAHDAWLVHRGVKTLALRMEAHCANALHLARFLAAHHAVARVYYPGLESHPQHALAARQMRLFGGMLSFEVRGGIEAARHVCTSLRLFAFAPSLGGVESLVGYPATMTHASLSAEQRAALGLSDGLIRLSAGIEAVEDLEQDLAAALRTLP